MYRCNSLEIDALAPTIKEITLFTGYVLLGKAFLLGPTPPSYSTTVPQTVSRPIFLASFCLFILLLLKLKCCCLHACATFVL